MNTVDLMGKDVYGWANSVKRFWNTILHLIYFIVTSTADYGVEVAARAIGIAAPLPNAISVFNISQHKLGFSPTQAFAFSFVIEVIVFALVEISLFLFDGFLRDKKKYLAPLVLSVTSVVAGVTIVIGIVYDLEVKGDGHTIMAWLPVISLCAFLSIGLKRWHERQKESGANRKGKPEKPQKETGNIGEISSRSSTSVEEMNEAKRGKIRKRQQEISNVISENGPLSISEIASLLSVSVSDKTIANDLNELASQGKVVKIGKKWDIARPVIDQLPEPVGFSKNGHSRH